MKKFFLFWAVCTTAQAITYLPHTATLNEDGMEILVDGSLFQTTGHLNTKGELMDQGENESFHQIESNLLISYGLTSQLQLSAGLRFRSNTATFDDAGEVGSVSSTGLDAYLVKFRYSFPRKDQVQWALEGEYSQTTYANEYVTDVSKLQDDLVLGDDGQSVSAGFSVSYLTDAQNFLSGQMKFRSPSKDQSSEMVTQAEYALAWESFSMYAGVENVTSLRQDPYTPDPENKPLMHTQSTALYNSVNRSWTAPYAGAILGLGTNWRIEYRISNTMIGSSTDTGIKHLVAISRRSGGVDGFKHLNSSFKEYTIESNITKVSKNKSSVVLDSGVSNGLQVGMKVDFYHFDYLGGNELIASGFVVKAGANKSMVKITRRFSKHKITTSTVARSGLISE